MKIENFVILKLCKFNEELRHVCINNYTQTIFNQIKKCLLRILLDTALLYIYTFMMYLAPSLFNF